MMKATMTSPESGTETDTKRNGKWDLFIQSLRMWRRWLNKLVVQVGFDKCSVKKLYTVCSERNKEEKQIIQWWCVIKISWGDDMYLGHE